jgi:guanosine-3',5'-bis(diphosphate) 3'-pyrophosphohydrolase
MTKEQEKLLEEVKMFAIRYHGLQDYAGFPYHKHLMDVEALVIKYSDDFELRLSAWLHDILEDCPVSYNDIKKKFGERVAEIVYRVTDELGRNRKERKKKTYPKIRECKYATLIKLCDRIANMSNSIQNGHSMSTAYVKEYEDFKRALKVEGEWEQVWSDLDELILGVIKFGVK